jgi:tripartite motif-containing protein 71
VVTHDIHEDGGRTGSGNGQFWRPHGVAVVSDGSVSLADLDNHCLQVFTSTGVFVTKWGTQGGGDGQFKYPKDVSVDPNGIVFVADRDNHRIQKFSVGQ